MWDQYKLKNGVENGSLRPMFHLEPIIADLNVVPVSMELAETIETLVHHNAWFSRVVLEADKDTDDEMWNLAFSRLMASLFDSTRRNPELATTRLFRSDIDPPSHLLQLGAVQLCCSWVGVSEFASMCSALVLNQTTQKLTLELCVNPQDEISSKQAWKWLAHALFSKRARAYSALESLALTTSTLCSLNIADAEAFAAVATSECPEEELFGWPRGAVEVGEAGLKSGASIRWHIEDERNYRVYILDSAVSFVLTYRDDGKSEWVDVLVPGYGRCEVQRVNLESTKSRSTKCGVTSLQLQFDENSVSSMSGLPRFMAVVGPSLKHLTLNYAELEVDKGLFLERCPNLETLSLRSRIVEARLDFRNYHKFHQSLPVVNHNLSDPTAAFKDLCDATNPLTSCLSRIRVRLGDIFNWYGRGVVEKNIEELLEILEVNQTVEYLDVIAPPDFHEDMDDYKFYDIQPICKTLEPLSTDCKKIAFLSVMTLGISPAKSKKMRKSQSCNSLCQLNDHVVGKIFAFAAPPVIRRVYVRKSNWSEDENDLPL